MRTHFYRRPYRRWSWTRMKRWPWRLGCATAHGAIAGIEESFVRPLAKVVRIMPPHLRRRVDVLRDDDAGRTTPNGDSAAGAESQTTTPLG